MSPHFSSLVDMLRHRASVTPETRAYTFLADGEMESDSLTWAQLDQRARAIAVALTSRGIRAGDRAILLYPPGLDFVPAFFGTLYAGVIAVPCYPPHPSQIARSLPRLLAVAGDADAAVVLAPEHIAELAPEIARLAPPLGHIPWIATDRCSRDMADAWHRPSITSDTLAFLQYTSGSTSTPRGVMVSHANLLHNLAYANHAEENDPSSIAVSWLPVIHDMGLIEGVLEPAFAGYPVYLMAPATFLQRPIRWLRAITHYRATNSGGPNFAYDLCTRKITAEQRATLDLSRWRVAYNGAEPIRPDTLTAFHRAFADRGFRWRSFYPVYGLAEATLVVSTGRLAYEPVFHAADTDALARGRLVAPLEGNDPVATTQRRITLASSGPIGCGTSVAIIDPETRLPCAPRQIGEIWISSPSVARGYWNRPDETEHTFNARRADGDPRPFLRTGDLGAIVDGELYVAGRLKDVIIVRGMNHYPQDIEATIEALHPAIRPGCSAAFAVPGTDDEQVAVAVEIDPRKLMRHRDRSRITPTSALSPDTLALFDDIERRVRDAVMQQHGIRLHAVAMLPPGGIPKTSSGKLRRHAAAAGFVRGDLHEVVRFTAGVPAQAPPLRKTGT